MVLVEQQPRRYTVCWSVIGGLLLLLSLYALVSEGRNGPWVLPLALSFPMFVGAAQGISKTMSMEMGRIIVGAFLAIGAWQGYATTQTFPYIVTYDFVGVWILCGLFCTFGFVASFSKSTRWPAKVFWASGIGLLIMFYLSLGVTQRLGSVAGKNWAGLYR